MKLTFVSIFSRDELSGHSILDDKYYVDYLVSKGVEFQYYTSGYSASQIGITHPNLKHCIYDLPNPSEKFWLLKVIKLIRSSSPHMVVFNGYSERFLILYRTLTFFGKGEIVLIATNNFSSRRTNKYSRLMRAIYYYCSPIISRIVVHTEFEKRAIEKLAPRLSEKVSVKKHHLMTPRKSSTTKNAEQRKIIVCMGPEKPDKNLKPFYDLVKADEGKIFDYVLVNGSMDAEDKIIGDKSESLRIEHLTGWQSSDYLIELIRNSTYIFMPHTFEFEGKLSGNLCDCVSNCIPYIAQPMEPMTSYQKVYGESGFLLDFSTPDWPLQILNGYSLSRWKTQIESLRKIGEDHSSKAVYRSLDSSLLSAWTVADS